MSSSKLSSHHLSLQARARFSDMELIDLPTKTVLRLYLANTNGKGKNECLPKNLEPNKIYDFYELGQHLYPFDRNIRLEALHPNKPSQLVAIVKITEITHDTAANNTTTGKYRVKELR